MEKEKKWGKNKYNLPSMRRSEDVDRASPCAKMLLSILTLCRNPKHGSPKCLSGLAVGFCWLSLAKMSSTDDKERVEMSWVEDSLVEGRVRI